MGFKFNTGMFAVSISVLAVSWATAATADDGSRLKGSYGFTGTAACLVAPGHVGDQTGRPFPIPHRA